MTGLAIIADDLSGALDSAAPFVLRGCHTVVALSPEALGKALATGAEVVAVSTDSREVGPETARQRVARALAHIPAGTRLFKKIDSRLKGNLVAELNALSFKKALVVPAIPAFGRWMRDRKLGGFGVDTPIDIADRLGPHAGRAEIPDVGTQDDICAVLARVDCDLLIGARALAEAQAERMARGTRTVETGSHRGPVILVIGSTDPITLEQVDRLRRRYPAAVYAPALNGVLPDRLQAKDGITILQAVPGAERADATAVAMGLAAALDPPEGALLIVSGGATAQAVLGRAGIEIVEVVGEVLPGMPLADAGRLKLITKSGGFGAPDTFVKILERQGVAQ